MWNIMLYLQPILELLEVSAVPIFIINVKIMERFCFFSLLNKSNLTSIDWGIELL